MLPVSPSGSYYQPPKKEAPATASSMQGRSINPHPEKSSIFKDIIKTISRVASTILIVPVIAAGVALGIANKLSSRSSAVGSTTFGATASKIRTFALRYLLIAPLGKMLLGDKAEPIASVKAKFEGLLTNSKHEPHQKENIQKAFTLIESAISSGKDSDLPEALALLMNNGAVDFVKELLPDLVQSGLIDEGISKKLSDMVDEKETGYFITHAKNAVNVYTACGKKKALEQLLFDYFAEHPVRTALGDDSQFVSKEHRWIDLQTSINESQKQILKELVRIPHDDSERELKIIFLKYAMDPSQTNAEQLDNHLKTLGPDHQGIPTWITGLSINKSQKEILKKLVRIPHNDPQRELKIIFLKYAMDPKAHKQLLFDYFVKHPLETSDVPFIRKEIELNEHIPEDHKQILEALVEIPKDDPERELKINFLKYAMDPSDVHIKQLVRKALQESPDKIPPFFYQKFPKLCAQIHEIPRLLNPLFSIHGPKLSTHLLKLKHILFNMLLTNTKDDIKVLRDELGKLIQQVDLDLVITKFILEQFLAAFYPTISTDIPKDSPSKKTRVSFSDTEAPETPVAATGTREVKSILKTPKPLSQESAHTQLFVTEPTAVAIKKCILKLTAKHDLSTNKPLVIEKLDAQKDRMLAQIVNLSVDDQSKIEGIFQCLNEIVQQWPSAQTQSAQARQIRQIIESSPHLKELKGQMSIGELLALGSPEDIALINLLVGI